jgi:hypothetical protein
MEIRAENSAKGKSFGQFSRSMNALINNNLAFDQGDERILSL